MHPKGRTYKVQDDVLLKDSRAWSSGMWKRAKGPIWSRWSRLNWSLQQASAEDGGQDQFETSTPPPPPKQSCRSIYALCSWSPKTMTVLRCPCPKPVPMRKHQSLSSLLSLQKTIYSIIPRGICKMGKSACTKLFPKYNFVTISHNCICILKKQCKIHVFVISM